MDTICANFGWPNADVFGTQRRPGATTVSDHGGSRTVLPEGVLPQRLHQEPEATRALLQHARRCRVSVQRHFRALPDGNTRPYPDINTFTGMCTTCNPATDPNCSPSRQGNGFLIPTPSPLPPCASAICGVAPLPGPKPIP